MKITVIDEHGISIVRDMTTEEVAEAEAIQRAEAEAEERAAQEYAASPAGRTEAQAYFTAVMTDTLIEE